MMAFLLHPNFDYRTKPQNPSIQDHVSSTKDFESCVLSCVIANTNPPEIYQAYPSPPYTGLVFRGGVYWLKSGFDENSISNYDTTAYAAVLHLLQ